MKKIYPKIKFVYSLPYNRLLAEYENKPFEERNYYKEIEKYIKKLKARWEKIDKSVFKTFEQVVGSKWQEKEIKCYVVKHCKYSGISNPLTIKIERDFDYIFDTLIHELAHILVSYELKKYKKIEQKLKKRFPKENQRIINHIYIIFIELQILKKLFSQSFINKIIKKTQNFEGIGKAYKIVLSKWSTLEKLFG